MAGKSILKQTPKLNNQTQIQHLLWVSSFLNTYEIFSEFLKYWEKVDFLDIAYTTLRTKI